MWWHGEKLAVRVAGRDTWPETGSDTAFILDFWPLELQENKFLLCKAPNLVCDNLLGQPKQANTVYKNLAPVWLHS